jgi:formylglycine-generating enzyme required for sulfatase activity
MSYCINPACLAPDKNSPTTNFCMSCGAKILLKDRYRALKLLGQGGFGKTFKAVDEDQPRKPLCVIKQFAFSNNHPETRQIALKLFYEEAQHLEALGKHDQIPELLAYFDVEGQPYLVQQFIDGQDLEQELATAGTFNQAKIHELLESLLPVLDFLHHQSPPVIHRDIKPANIIRRRSDGGLVLVDFGAAKQATQTMLAKTGTMIGSPEYTAPEQTRGKPVFASDIYSLGVTCIHLLTNVPPFDLFDTSQDDWVWRNYLVNNPVDKLLGEVLDGSIVNALARRYQSATEVLAALNTKSMVSSVTQSPSTASAKTLKKEPKLESFSFKITQLKIVRVKGFFGGTKKIIVDSSTSTGQAKGFIEDLGNGVKLEMMKIPAGRFLMGSPDGAHVSETPQHWVDVPEFYMGKYVVTQRQFAAMMEEQNAYPSVGPEGDDLPVNNVWWGHIQEFCTKLTKKTGREYRLPSEAEWEYACRAGTATLFHFGDIIITEVANFDGSRFHGELPKGKHLWETTPVGSFGVANAFGLYDMHGNVMEWCSDNHSSDYKRAPINGSAWINKRSHEHVLRGGSRNCDSNACRSAYRAHHFRSLDSNSYQGFRLVLSMRTL